MYEDNRAIMSERDDNDTGAAPPTGRRRRGERDWIGDQLRRVYKEAEGEGIPDDMMSLLNQLDTAPGNPDDKKENDGGG